jgi:hypothetical protein
VPGPQSFGNPPQGYQSNVYGQGGSSTMYGGAQPGAAPDQGFNPPSGQNYGAPQGGGFANPAPGTPYGGTQYGGSQYGAPATGQGAGGQGQVGQAPMGQGSMGQGGFAPPATGQGQGGGFAYPNQGQPDNFATTQYGQPTQSYDYSQPADPSRGGANNKLAPTGGWPYVEGQTEAPKRSRRGVTIAVIAVAILVVVGIGGYVGLKLATANNQFVVGACVKEGPNNSATIVDCTTSGAYRITKVVDTESGCGDASQPSVILNENNATTYACLAPA